MLYFPSLTSWLNPLWIQDRFLINLTGNVGKQAVSEHNLQWGQKHVSWNFEALVTYMLQIHSYASDVENHF